jgi:phosphinothricin acetyltransferase
MLSSPALRPAADSDLPAIAAIYAHYVLNTTASFEIDPPPVEELARRRAEVLRHGLPYLVVEFGGAIGGYAYAVPYRSRPAYRYTAEDSIYLHPAHSGRGLGRLLLTAVIDACAERGYRQMIAVIGDSANQASIGFHARMGFEPAGVLRNVGFKFNRWVDSVLMQRAVGPGAATLPAR